MIYIHIFITALKNQLFNGKWFTGTTEHIPYLEIK